MILLGKVVILFMVSLYIGNLIYKLSLLVIEEDNFNFKVFKWCFLRKRSDSLLFYIFECFFSILCTAIFIKYGFTLLFFKYMVLISFLLLISLIDCNTKYIYSAISYIALALSVIFLIYSFFNHQMVFEYLLGGIISFLVILLMSLISKEGIGLGDADIFLIVGINLGLINSIKIFAITFMLSGILCIYKLIKKQKNAYIALTPFITTAVVFVILS
ncbi:prepilin peptidase [Clostridium tyrobutyricum]|uniref:prepilin peptidase n=2 Tax=Clostridium tyrobutyricum TaxID=1519 RepID=UPI0031197AF8